MEQQIQQLIDDTWEEIKKNTHPDDLPGKVKNYKKTHKQIDVIINDLKDDIYCLLNE